MFRSRIATVGLASLALYACSDSRQPSTPLTPGEVSFRRDPAPVKVHKGKKIPGQYIVVLEDAAEPSAVLARHQATPMFTYGSAIRGFAAKLSRGQLQKLQRDADVKYIEEDGVFSIDQDPRADPMNRAGSSEPPGMGASSVQLGATWGIDKLDQEWSNGTNGSYNYTNTGLGVRIYVLDTGIRITHNDFDGLIANRASYGYDFVDNDAIAQDCHGHGTHVAGSAMGAVYGVNKRAKAVAVRVLNCAGSGSTSGVIAGVDWVSNNHIKPAVANMSLGGGFSQALNDAVTKSISYGVVYVVAAGNSNLNACNFSPSSTPNALTVAASDINNNRAGFSNFGACVDLYAPGVNITSAWYTSNTATNTINGTSMSSPHVAGLVASYLEANWTAAYGMVADVILRSALENVVGGNPAGTVNRLAHSINGIVGGNGATVQEPDVVNGQWYYFSNTAGYHHVWLRGTPGTNLNLEFYRWNGSTWVLVATKATASTNEYLVYNGAAGFYYMYLVRSAASTSGGSYDSYVIRPS